MQLASANRTSERGRRGPSGSEFVLRPSGFTLIELMIVLTLIGIMTAMILPEMRGTYEEALLRSNSRRLISVLNLAYSQAVSSSQMHRVRLDRSSGHYAIERVARDGEGASGFVPLKNVPGGEGDLDTRISIQIQKRDDSSPSPDDQTGPGAADASVEGAPNTIAFFANGTAEAGEILLKDREGFRLALRINPTTARVRIVPMERE